MNEQYNYSLGLNSSQNKFKRNSIFGEPPPDYIPGKGRGAVGFASGVSRDDPSTVIEIDLGDYSDTKFDKFSGFSEVLFKNSKYDDEDKQADSIYDMIDEKLGERRKIQREKKLREEIERTREYRPTIQQQFLDLKRSLKDVKLEEWDSIPELGDYLTKNKKANYLTPVPENVAAKSSESDLLGVLKKHSGNFFTNKTGDTNSLNELGTAKGNILSIKLDKAMDNVSGQSVIDASSYLDTLNSLDGKVNGNASDIRKARLLLKSVVNTNPKHAPCWIAAARFEEVMGRISQARELLTKGCEMCPKSEDIWLEAIRIEKKGDTNKLISKAIKNVPNSAKIWLEAANRETSKNKKLLIIKKGLEIIPNSLKLWKEAISLVEEESMRHLLMNAVKCVPQHEEFWLRLSSISDYSDAQKILNEARKELPTSPGIWVAAAKLEESVNKSNKVETIIKRCLSSLSAKRFVHSRADWLEKAIQCEKEGFPVTCSSIIKNTLFLGIEENQIEDELFSDIDKLIGNGNIITSRAIFEVSSFKLKTKKNFWIKWVDFEEKYGEKDKIDTVLQESLKHCPEKEELWLKAAKNQATNGNIELARFILSKGYTNVKDKEQIVLAAVKLENSQGETERARVLLERERTNSPTVKIWVESIQLERKHKEYDRCMSFCSDSVKLFPNSPELWLLYAKVHSEIHKNKTSETISILEDGIKYCDKSVDLWLSLVDLLISEMNWKKARTMLELARSKIVNQPELWIQTILLEKKAGNVSFIPQLISRALKECPRSGLLYKESISYERDKKQKSKYISALEQCGNDPYILTSIAILFWKENNHNKARDWFERAIEVDQELGDTWLHFIVFELLNGNNKTQIDIVQRFIASKPNKGFEWNQIKRICCSWDLNCNEILIKLLHSKYNILCDYLSFEIKDLLGTT